MDKKTEKNNIKNIVVDYFSDDRRKFFTSNNDLENY